MRESATAELLPVLIRIQGRDYTWEPGQGLDPEAVLTLTRFIWREALRYAGPGAKVGLTVEDLVQEGRHGALVAARRFDPEKGQRFITYAVWWIRCRLLEALRKHVVTIPREVIYTLRATGEIPGVCSLDMPVLEDGTPLGACLAGSEDASTAEGAVAAMEVRRLLKLLKPRERHILIRRFGLGQPAETLDAIGISLGMSRERVRQLESLALGRLRNAIARKG